MKRLLIIAYHTLKNRKTRIRISFSSVISLKSYFEGNNRIGKRTLFTGEIGYASYIGEECRINGKIGRFSCIGSRVVFTKGKHPVHDWVSIHPAFYSTAKQCGFTFVDNNKFEEYGAITEIGNDVWIGDSSIILEGVKIGDGAVIAAGSVVTKDVPPYSIVGGNPAHIIRYRFTQTEIEFLLMDKWWDDSADLLRKKADLFSQIDRYVNSKLKGNKDGK